MKYTFVFEHTKNEKAFCFNEKQIKIETFALDAANDGGKMLLEQNYYSSKNYTLIYVFDNSSGKEIKAFI